MRRVCYSNELVRLMKINATFAAPFQLDRIEKKTLPFVAKRGVRGTQHYSANKE